MIGWSRRAGDGSGRCELDSEQLVLLKESNALFFAASTQARDQTTRKAQRSNVESIKAVPSSPYLLAIVCLPSITAETGVKSIGRDDGRCLGPARGGMIPDIVAVSPGDGFVLPTVVHLCQLRDSPVQPFTLCFLPLSPNYPPATRLLSRLITPLGQPSSRARHNAEVRRRDWRVRRRNNFRPVFEKN